MKSIRCVSIVVVLLLALTTPAWAGESTTGSPDAGVVCESLAAGSDVQIDGIDAADFLGDLELGLAAGSAVNRPFRMIGAGQVSFGGPTTLIFSFSGVATHLGKYTSVGFFDLKTFVVTGSFVAANGDAIDWTAAVVPPGPKGDLPALFTFTGGTGRFANASGGAAGTIFLNLDLSFQFSLQGTISY